MMAGFELSAKSTTLLSVIMLLFLVNVMVSYVSTFNKVASKDMPTIKSGRLDVKNGTWDLGKHMIVDETRNASESTVKALIPLGAVLGTLLYRNFPGQEVELGAIYNFFLAVLMGNVMGTHIAACRHILMIEKKYDKQIQV